MKRFVELKARYSFLIDGNPKLSREEQKKVFQKLSRCRKGSEAWIRNRDRILKCNIKLALWVFYRYKRFWLKNQLDDTFQEAILGLGKAIEMYDLSKGTQFTTYAPYWISQYMRKYFHKMARQAYISTTEYYAKKPYIRREVSLDEKIKGDSDTIRHDIVTPEKHQSEEDEIIVKAEVVRQLDRLANDRERYIIARLYGIGGKKAGNAAVIGEELGICRERVRQLKNKAFKTLGIKYDLKLSFTKVTYYTKRIRKEVG